MSSNSGSYSNSTIPNIGKGIEDNGAKWGSYVTRNADGTFPFDERMKKERPSDWTNMITERLGTIVAVARNPPHKIPKKWAQGRTHW